jgi:hypothetical protein
MTQYEKLVLQLLTMIAMAVMQPVMYNAPISQNVFEAVKKVVNE